jgi:hypothetical protein
MDHHEKINTNTHPNTMTENDTQDKPFHLKNNFSNSNGDFVGDFDSYTPKGNSSIPDIVLPLNFGLLSNSNNNADSYDNATGPVTPHSFSPNVVSDSMYSTYTGSKNTEVPSLPSGFGTQPKDRDTRDKQPQKDPLSKESKTEKSDRTEKSERPDRPVSNSYLNHPLLSTGGRSLRSLTNPVAMDGEKDYELIQGI